MEFSGSINYAEAVADGKDARLSLQGMANMVRGLLEYPATPIWYTVWRVYDPYARLLKEDSRSHSIMFFSQMDSASDDLTLTVPVAAYYQVQLWGKLSGGEKLIDTAIISLGYVPSPAPAPVTPAPVAPTPTPRPVPLPTPTPYPAPAPGTTAFDWKSLIIPAGIALAVILLLPGGKTK